MAKKMKESLTDAADLKFNGLALVTMPEGHVWLVTFATDPVPPTNDEPPPLDEITILVLMDGTVVQPTIDKMAKNEKKLSD